jgi:hypothetical protein
VVAAEATRAVGDADPRAKDESRTFFQRDGKVEMMPSSSLGDLR